MKNSLYKTCSIPKLCLLYLAFWLSYCNSVSAQNLVPNPGFEVESGCPVFVDCQNDIPPCPPWLCINSSVNFFNSCTDWPYDVPVNAWGYQFPHGGEGYAGGYLKIGQEHNQVQLLRPLVAGKCYYAGMYINLSNNTCAVSKIGMLFTEELIPSPGPVGMHPQIEGTGQFYTDTLNWTLISGTFIAFGGEEWLSIGNFYTNVQTPYSPECPDTNLHSYYYFDDIVVEELPTDLIDIELGGPYVECDSFTLHPNLDGVLYHWSDGSTEPTLTVTTSGTYSVTVYTEDCSAGIDMVDIEILGFPDVGLGPDQILCEGETYTIQLDEDAGDYTWSDGSNESAFTISAPGIYGVTLDDGCGISIDYVVVEYLSPPFFTLGEDTLLCPGEEYQIQFDPEMGDYVWQDNSTFFIHTIEGPGMYSLTVTNQCGEVSDEIEITSIDPPAFNLGPDSTTVCLGNTINLQFDPAMGDFEWQDGSTNPSFIISGTGLYSLNVSNACGSLSDEIYVEQITVPVVVLGGSYLLCNGETELLDPGYNYGNYMWQDGSTEQLYEVTTSGTYIVTVTNPCGTAIDSTVVEVLPLLIPPDLGPDVILCTGNQFLLTVPQQPGTIQWSDMSHNDSLYITISGTYYVEVSTLCESYADTVQVTFEDNAPSVNLPADFAICQGQSAILETDITNVNYVWNDGSQLSQLIVSSPGIYSVTITNMCGTDTDSITILNGGLAPLVALGPDTSLCTGDSIVLQPTFAYVNEWIWQDGSDTTFYVANIPGQVYVAVSNDCGLAYDTVMIDLLPAVPDLYIGTDTSICPGATVTLSINIPGVSILWPDGSSEQEYFVTDSTTVIASISNACGVATDSLDVDLYPEIPFLYLGPDQSLCPGELITISPGILDVGYLWQDGSTLPSFQTSMADTIILMISNICGDNIDTLEIIESTLGPQVDLGPDLFGCIGSTLLIPANIFGVNYQWQDGSTDAVFMATTSGTYYLAVDNLCGSDSDTIHVDLSGLPPTVSFGPDTTLCVGTSLSLSSLVDTSATIEWQDGSTNPEFEVTVSGEYYLTASNLCGTDSDTIEVDISAIAPIVDLGPDTLLCEGVKLILSAEAHANTTTHWQDGSTDLEFEVVTSGVYHLTQHNECGIDSDTINVSIQGTPPSPDLGPDTSLCNGSTLILSSIPDPEIQSEWTDGSSALTYIVESAGIYTLTQENRCGSRTDSINITYQSPPDEFDLGPDTLLCPGEIILLNSPFTTDQLMWQDGSSGSSLLVDQAGKYELTIWNECGIAIDAIEINYEDKSIQFPLEVEVMLCDGLSIDLDVSQSFPATYAWSTGSTFPTITITTPGTYSVTVRTDCLSETHIIAVFRDQECSPDNGIYIPNVFSPNGDNINDVFSMVISSDIEITFMEGTIFDRWGENLYYSTSNPFTWDGQQHGVDMLPGVYVYLLHVNFTWNGREYSRQLAGDITLLR